MDWYKSTLFILQIGALTEICVVYLGILQERVICSDMNTFHGIKEIMKRKGKTKEILRGKPS